MSGSEVPITLVDQFSNHTLRLVGLINESDALREVLSDVGRSQLWACSRHMQCKHMKKKGPDDILLRTHGDVGPFFKNRNLLVLSLSFPYNHGAARLCIRRRI